MLEAYENDHGKCGNVIDINHEKQEYEEMFLERTAEHTRAFIKVRGRMQPVLQLLYHSFCKRKSAEQKF